MLVGTTSWREQFVEALKVGSGIKFDSKWYQQKIPRYSNKQKFFLDDDDEEDENAEPKSPGCSDYMMHYLSLFWKILFAFVPPTGLSNIFISNLKALKI